ncbi:MAG TPA: VWA domain-containing protein [Blastocatellia bacterium]|nr:VWA domain-containing protein [Blastocatellia bacterium]
MRSAALLFIAGFLTYVGLAFQADSRALAQQQKSDTVKIRSTEILVDAVVADRKNRPVTDLTAQDFEVYEDGVLQNVTFFRVVRGSIDAPGEARSSARTAPAPSPEPAVEPAKPVPGPETLPNVTIVLLDYSTTQIQHKRLIQDAAIKYVEKRLQPNDLMAVFVLGAGLHIASDFTADKAKLVAALKQTSLTGSAMASDRADMSAAIDKGDLAQNQVDVEGGGGASGQAAGAQASAMAASLIAQHFAAMHIGMRAGMDRIQSLGVLSAIRAIAMGVKGIEARKTLLLFSEGFVAGPSVEEELRLVEGLANRSHLAIYCIEAQGLETRELKGDLVPRDELTATAAAPQRSRMQGNGGEIGFDRASEAGVDVREGPLRGLSTSTGGFLIRNTNDLGTGLDRIDAEMRSYYLLSYVPKDEKLDGGFRQIRVSVKKPDLTVRARSGYYAMPPGYDLLSPEEFKLMGEAHAADPSTRIPLFMRAGGFQEGKSEYRVPIVVEIPYSSIRFDASKGGHSARLAILGTVKDAGGNLVRRFGDPVQMNLTDAQYNTLKAGTISLMNQVRLPVGDYSVELYVKDVLSGRVSDGRQPLYLGQMETTFGLSAVLLASDRELYKSSGDDQFLTVQGVKIMPSAACQFRNGDNMIFYLDIYNPQTDKDKKKTDLSIDVQFERDGQPVNAVLPAFQVSESPGGAVPRVTFCRFLKLGGLKPGNYNLVVSVKDKISNQGGRRQVAFSVLN